MSATTKVGVEFIGLPESILKTNKNIVEIYNRKIAAAFALAMSYSAQAINLFRTNQSENKYWKNKTQQAFQRVFGNAFNEDKEIGFFLAHGVDYGVYLELANNRKHATLKPIITELGSKYLKAVRELFE